MPTRAAPTTFRARPSLKRKPRREGEESPGRSWFAHMGSALFLLVQPPRHGTALGDEPRDHVRNLPLGQRPRRIAAPIRHAEIGPSRYHHGAEVLVARERPVPPHRGDSGT